MDYLRPVRTRTLELLDDQKYLDQVLAEGAAKAQAVASKTLADVYERIGLIPRA